MKRKLLTFIVTLLVLVSGLFVTSCAVTKDADGNTFIRLSPTAHKTIEDVGKAGTDILGILSLFMPFLAPAATAAAAGTYTWSRMGKKVTKYQTPLEHVVNVLEEVKKDEKLWEQIKPFLKGDMPEVWSVPSAKTEATIREVIDKNAGAV